MSIFTRFASRVSKSIRKAVGLVGREVADVATEMVQDAAERARSLPREVRREAPDHFQNVVRALLSGNRSVPENAIEALEDLFRRYGVTTTVKELDPERKRQFAMECLQVCGEYGVELSDHFQGKLFEIIIPVDEFWPRE